VLLEVGRSVNQERGMGGLIQIVRCRRGANAIEYALVASLIAIAAVAAMQKLGTSVDSMLNNVSNVM
jgi:pilus assembly protein Flp/PilA